MRIADSPSPVASQVLDVVAATFGGVLRRSGVATSPAEVLEVRRVLALMGIGDRTISRAALRAVCAKYSYEQPAFDRAFDQFFGAVSAAVVQLREASHSEFADGLPVSLEVGDDPGTGKYADHNDRANEIGDYFDTPERDRGFNPHKDDDDVSMAASDAALSVSTESDSGKRGMGYTLEVERAGTTTVGDLASSASAVVAGTLSWEDPASILAWLDSYDPASVYADAEDGERLTAAQLAKLAEAVEAFVDALAASRPLDQQESESNMEADTASANVRAEVNQACHEVLRRMRGPVRSQPRERAAGRLDMRRTVRAGMRTEGIPFHLVVKAQRPAKPRILILADVSLSVRPVTAFTLRLAQAMHRRASRCRVLAFVDRPVDVTETLWAAQGDDALAAVLADPRIDLEATSDYGRVFSEVMENHGNEVNSRTSVLVVGDGRCNGLPTGIEHFTGLSRKVHRLAWITPEPERYWKQATCSMPAYAKACDEVVVARDATQLMERAADLGSALR